MVMHYSALLIGSLQLRPYGEERSRVTSAGTSPQPLPKSTFSWLEDAGRTIDNHNGKFVCFKSLHYFLSLSAVQKLGERGEFSADILLRLLLWPILSYVNSVLVFSNVPKSTFLSFMLFEISDEI